MPIVTLTHPVTEPLALAELKAHLRIETEQEDASLVAILAAARVAVESDNGHRIVCQQVLQTLDGFPSFSRQGAWAGGSEILLGAGPLMQFQSIQYTDSDGQIQTFATTDYIVNAYADPAYICPAFGLSWPAARVVPNTVQLRYLVGSVTMFTAEVTANTITLYGRTPTSGETLWFTNSGGLLPAPLVANKAYIATSPSGNSCVVTDPETGVVILTNAGTGLRFVGFRPPDLVAAIKLMAGHLYENREVVNIGNIVNSFPLGYQSLVWRDAYVRIV